MPAPTVLRSLPRQIAAASLLGIAVTTSAIPLQNSDFNAPLVPSDKDLLHFNLLALQAPAEFGWSHVAGTIELMSGNYWWGAGGAGDQSLDLNGNGPGTIHQDVHLGPGRYAVDFALAGNPDGGDVKQVRVWLGDSYNDFSFDSSGRSHTDMGWEIERSIFAIGSEGLYTLKFESLTSGPWGVALDDISLQAVPETLGGFGTAWLALFTVAGAIFGRRSFLQRQS